jgi:endonuclease-3
LQNFASIKRKFFNKGSNALGVLRVLKELYPELPKSFLTHNSSFELLVATLLSAQCTDDRVNKVTPHLFAKAPDPLSMLNLGEIEIRKTISSINFFNTKAKNIFNLSKILIEKFNSTVPQNLESLVSLPGIGRKTANVVLGNAFNMPSMVVDTHVKRTSARLGWTAFEDPEKVETDLMKLFPETEWVDLSHRLILLGRNYCQARKPKCGSCPLMSLCPTGQRKEFLR